MSGTHNKGKRRKPWAKLVCAICGKDYEVEPYRRPKSKTCSYQCAQQYAAKHAAKVQIAKRGTGKKHRYVKELGRHQHRVVAEEVLGRPLKTGEIVHHKDNDGHNNNPDNLQITTQSEHIKIHRPYMMRRRKEVAGY